VSGDLAGKSVVVTAGGTREPIDPVRFIGNRSSGKMGFALAEAARDHGANVTLVTTIMPPNPEYYDKVELVETVAEMREAVLRVCRSADVLIMAAAVSDYRVANPATDKIKKQGGKLILELVETEDFLLELPDNFIKVGFAAETSNLLINAEKKLTQKRLDFICANDVSAPDSGFAVDTNKVTLIDKQGKVEELPLLTKREVADKILGRVVGLIKHRQRR
jgi:phosphopantothenoylcysteine decarboxylase/phosphopantothenate--cysteine ligase